MDKIGRTTTKEDVAEAVEVETVAPKVKTGKIIRCRDHKTSKICKDQTCKMEDKAEMGQTEDKDEMDKTEGKGKIGNRTKWVTCKISKTCMVTGETIKIMTTINVNISIVRWL